MLIDKRYPFTTNVLSVIANFLGMLLLCSLGMWQIHRAHYKEHLQTLFTIRQQTAPQTLTDVITQHQEINYFPVKLQGHFDNQHTYLLDNRFYHHQLGYEVITPFILENQQKTILINRGWIAASNDRHQLPKIAAIDQRVSLTGIIYQTDKKSLTLSNQDDSPKAWPKRIEKIDFNTLAMQLQKPVYPFLVLLNINQPGTLPRDWKVIQTQPAKHYAYALQWFSFALILLVGFLIVNRQHRSKHL